MNRIKIIFFDIDGTLVDHATGQISENTRQALHRLHKNGMILCIATGRPTASLPDLSGLPFDAFCTFNGSLCYTEKELIHHTPLTPQDVAKVLKNAETIGRPVCVAVRDRLAANGFDQDLADYYALAGLTLTVAEDFHAVCTEDIYQIMLGCRPKDHPSILQGTKGVKIAVSWDRAVDIIPADGGKTVGISKMLEHFHLEASDALAFGDGLNDMEMLRYVGTGVAMGNAPDELKAVADTVCDPVSQDGIYRYCLENGLI